MDKNKNSGKAKNIKKLLKGDAMYYNANANNMNLDLE